ncbi:hypothetical protein GF354_02945 [Candidatus Peregrinibacteria bacterium]|nr:hypothetical protein [Candidatus Peregrinibacteria bacterium]
MENKQLATKGLLFQSKNTRIQTATSFNDYCNKFRYLNGKTALTYT